MGNRNIFKFTFKLLRWTLRIAVFLAVVLALCMAALFIIAKTRPAPSGAYSAVIILGAQVKEDGTLSEQLKDRLDLGLQLWRARPESTIVVCGGRGTNEPVAEGDAMKSYLTANGVPDNQVLAETQSRNTKENIRLAKAMLGQENRAVIITSDYHVLRAVRIAKDEGFEAEGAGAATKPEWFIKNYARETLAWGKYFLNRWLSE